MKILVIRFSSIGDLTQSLSIPALIKENQPNAEIHFLTRSDFETLVQSCPSISKIWSLDKNKGLSEILKLARVLSAEKFDVIYDAHNNLRSFLFRHLISADKKIVKPMFRLKRFLLIKFKLNYFEMPFSGQRDLLKPLEQLGLNFRLPKPPVIQIKVHIKEKVSQQLEMLNIKNFIVLVPSAAYQLKRWPVDHWHKLIQNNSDKKIIILAGPNDEFTKQFNDYSHVTNLTGQTSLLESAGYIEQAALVISNDTGMLHIAEQLGKKTIALMGPAPFGFPSRASTVILEKNLSCRPCSKHGQGPCVNTIYHQCMVDITPDLVQQNILRLNL